MKRILIVFAKEPQEGRVKTRLLDCLSARECLKLYKKLLKNTVSLARKVKCSGRIMAYDSYNQRAPFLERIASDFTFYKQAGRGLGARMFDVFKAILKSNTKAVIIGSDSPNLPINYIDRAFEKLSKNDLVLGPADDGGYYLIGLKQPCKKLFENIKWSSGTVFDRTVKKAKKLKKKTTVLDYWYDIDEPKDLKYIRKKPESVDR
ncbi:MAG: TIGR04282 family arsenosugar biosynthesis glycosyltransferase [Candidatus Omnitrophica bacterium]|nr:TIGR04282 family arsenosugar biosynthesis glycosyltransferase [Candidatus Omnitrophota bacterium]